MSGAETARRPVVQRRIGGAETAAPKWPSPLISSVESMQSCGATGSVVFCRNVYLVHYRYPIGRLEAVPPQKDHEDKVV